MSIEFRNERFEGWPKSDRSDHIYGLLTPRPLERRSGFRAAIPVARVKGEQRQFTCSLVQLSSPETRHISRCRLPSPKPDCPERCY